MNRVVPEMIIYPQYQGAFDEPMGHWVLVKVSMMLKQPFCRILVDKLSQTTVDAFHQNDAITLVNINGKL